ncbi:Nitrogen permease regulator 2-like protein [Trichinella nelsoni]|uniref:Nitrogen permease regulator 2-like protein n=1 Tax=Trichinella nelsoni TaxID=6336 RepID=A0A0V0RRU7_9BILA|nr:Nitrogen permease regulator 2-like protein [Trichinella nelsoni]
MVVQFFSELLVVSMVNYVLVVLCGASTSTIKENYLLAAIITVCTAVPALLFIPNWDQLLGVVFEKKLIRKTDFFVHYITHGTYLGAYLGAIPIPLDWDRPWQRWPITCVVGALIGFGIGNICACVHPKSRRAMMASLAPSSPNCDVPPLLGIFYAEFDSHLGPRILCQVPPDKQFIERDVFDTVSSFIITKSKLVDQLVKVDLADVKIIGYPKAIPGNQYDRNAYIFNVCFVVANTKTNDRDYVYEPLLEKLAKSLEMLERQRQFLSNQSLPALSAMLTKLYNELNETGCSSIILGDHYQVHLALLDHRPSVPVVSASMAPVVCTKVDKLLANSSDQVLRRLLPLINGFDSVAKLSSAAKVDIEITKQCLTDAAVAGVVSFVPTLQYKRCYMVTPQIGTLYRDKALQQDLCHTVKLRGSPMPKFSDVFRLLSFLKPSLTMHEWSYTYTPKNYHVHEGKLIQYALLKGLIRQISAYPILLANCNPKFDGSVSRIDCQQLDGGKSIEELSVNANVHCLRAEKVFEESPHNSEIRYQNFLSKKGYRLIQTLIDADCPPGEKCCPTKDAFKICIKPRKEVKKRGSCPILKSSEIVGNLIMCNSDGNCRGVKNDVAKTSENDSAITVQFLATNSNCTQLEWMKHDPKDCPPITTESTSKFIVVTAIGRPSTNGKLTVNGNYRPAKEEDFLETD